MVVAELRGDHAGIAGGGMREGAVTGELGQIAAGVRVSSQEPLFENADDPGDIRGALNRPAGGVGLVMAGSVAEIDNVSGRWDGFEASREVPCRGVGSGVNSSQLGDIDMGIDLCRRQTFMPQHRLHPTHIRAAFQHEGGDGVAKQMRPTMRDAGGS